MFYSDDLIEEVRSRNDIVDVISGSVKLQKKGSSYFGLCPFHNEKSPSFSVSRQKQMYYCFGCGATGDVIQFVANLFGLSNYEAAKKIAVDFGITPDNPPVIAALKKTEYMETKSRQKELRECQKMVCEYLHRLEKWKALYAPERPDLPMDERFEEACENLSYIEYLADYLTFADEEEGFEVVKSMKETGYLEDLKYLLGVREEDVYAEEAKAA